MNGQQDPGSDATHMGAVSNRQWVLRAMENGQEFVLQGDMLVGREAECQVQVLSGHISRYHAKIRVTPAGIILEDLNSTNGTFVNGRRLTAPKVLSMGDEVVFHTERFRLVSGRSGDAEATMIMSVSPRLADRMASLAEHQDAPEEVVAPVVPFPVANEVASRVNVPDDATRILSGIEIAHKADRVRLPAHGPRVPGSGPRLVVMTAPLRGKVLALTEQKLGTTWRLGRGESCELRINEATVSHDHARVVRSAEGWHIAVTSARNAMVVNGEIETSQALRNGDRLLLGRIEIVFATDVDEVVPVMLPPPEPLYMNPWFVGAAVFFAVASLGSLGALLLQ